MHPISVAQALRRFGQRDQPPVAIGLGDVFGDRARLGDGIAVVGDDGRFSERMDRAQLFGRAHVRLTLMADDLVRHAKLFQQPQHALRTGIVEMMDGEHDGSPARAADGRRLGGASRTQESRDGGRCYFTRMLLTDPIYPGNIPPQLRDFPVNPRPQVTYIAFEGDRCIASGGVRDVVSATKTTLDRRKDASVQIFDGSTGGPIEIDFRGSIDDVLARLPEAANRAAAAEDAVATPRGPARPKLGVVAREVTLLPRHWEWLAQQPGGASVALRRLVDEARRTCADGDRIRQAQEATYRFMSAA